MPVTLAQVAVPSLTSIVDFGVALVGLLVFSMLLFKAYKDRKDKPAAPYLGTPMIVITLVILTILFAGGTIALDAYTGIFAMVFGFVLKIAMTALVWPFWLAGLLVIPSAHIYPYLADAFRSIKR